MRPPDQAPPRGPDRRGLTSERPADRPPSEAPCPGNRALYSGGATTREDAVLRESLLEQPAAAAAEGGVPKGYFAVYAGEESQRFVVPTGYLREPAFRDLMERAAAEFGFTQAGGACRAPRMTSRVQAN